MIISGGIDLAVGSMTTLTGVLVHRDFVLANNLDAASNVFLGEEIVARRIGPLRVMDKHRMEQETRRPLDHHHQPPPGRPRPPGYRVMVMRMGRKVADQPATGDMHASRERVVAWMAGAP